MLWVLGFRVYRVGCRKAFLWSVARLLVSVSGFEGFDGVDGFWVQLCLVWPYL